MPTTHFVNFAATIIFYLYLLIPENYEEFDYDLPRTGSVCQHERSKTRCYEPCGSSADERRNFGFPIAEVRYFAETQLGIKDGSYEAGKEEAKNQATPQPPIEDFFTSTCSSIIKRIAEAKELAYKNGSKYGLSYLVGCFEIASSSIKKYIQTQQKGGK